MGNIQLLDCTLRDGGYINDWSFGKKAIDETIQKITESGVDIFEIGFLKDEKYEKDRTVFNSMEQISELIKPKNSNVKYAAMIEVVNPLPLEKLEKNSKETVDIIRVIVWKRLLKEGFEYCKGVVEKGYKLCVQPARVDQYSYEEFTEMLEMFATLDPMAIYVVDSFGTQTSETLLPYFKLADEKLPASVAIGYHGHNNMMQAMDIAEAFIGLELKCDIIIDASIYGMGRGAGNLNLELIAKYLNEQNGKSYKTKPMLEIYDRHLKSIYSWCPWGYSLPYYLTATYGCNPNYASYYDWEQHVSAEEIQSVIQTLSEEDKIIFTKEKAEKALTAYRRKNLRLAVIVPTHNRSAGVKYYIDVAGKVFQRYGVDLIFYDSSSDDVTKEIVKMCNMPNVIYRRYTGPTDDKTIDYKVFNAAKDFVEEYDYIWICRDRSVPNFDVIYEKLRLASQKNLDFMIIYPHWIDSQYFGEKEFTNCCELFRSLFGEMTSLGSIVLSSKVLKSLVNEYPVDKERNYGLWLVVPLFHYIATHKFKAVFYCNNAFQYIPIYTTSFWIKSNTLLWLWTERWTTIMSFLPDIYNKEKADVLKFLNWSIKPFSLQLLLTNRADGGFRFRDIQEYKKYIPQVSDKPLWWFYIVAMLPPKAVAHYLSHPTSIFSRISRWASRKIFLPLKKCVSCIHRDLYALFYSRKKRKFSGIDYEAYTDCFVECKDVSSHLLYGNINQVPKPWITVVIPTYRRVDLLEDALNSVLHQRSVDYEWDVLVIDNEPYDGKPNQTQKYIETLNNPRILYYRNEKNMGAGGNINRGVELARGKWISLLHDDDILIHEYLYRIGKRIVFLEQKKGKPLGFISGTHEQFAGPSLKKDYATRMRILDGDYAICSSADTGKIQRVRQFELIITGSVGVFAPTVGTVISKKAFMESGGYNEKKCIADDLVFAYKMMRTYAVYRNCEPLGFYRWYDNASKGRLVKIENDLFDFREYAYRKNPLYRLFGGLFRQEHFVSEVRGLITMARLDYNLQLFEQFETIMKYRPNKLRELLYRMAVKCYRAFLKLTTVRCDT